MAVRFLSEALIAAQLEPIGGSAGFSSVDERGRHKGNSHAAFVDGFRAGNALRSLGSYCDAKGGGLFSWMHLEQCLYGLRRKQPIWFIASKSIARRCSLRIRRLARQDLSNFDRC